MIWEEKYRPTEFEDVVCLPVTLKEIVKEDLPNLLFIGKPGTGKTTTAKIIIKKLGCQSLILNASDERGIDVIRNKVKDFAMTQSINGKIKICFLDEFDYLCLSKDTKIKVGTKNKLGVKEIGQLKENKRIMIPSVNIETGKIENDYGKMIINGEFELYEVELEDGRKIECSMKHPFFKKGFIRTELKDLKIGDEIIDYDDEINNHCLICRKQLKYKYKVTCSMECKNKLHSQRMTGKGNSRYGINSWNKNLTKQIDSRVARQGALGTKNGNHKINGGKWQDKNTIFWNKATEEECNKILKTKGKGNSCVYIHHIDKNRNNNKRENLMFVCPKCHNNVCHKRGKK
jgi:hypothetical protein